MELNLHCFADSKIYLGFRPMIQKLPRISVVTINFNHKEGLEKTIKSTVSQSYENLEYIVIDGASSDGSKEVIENYADSIVYWVSEPDGGIYDAMNKGALAATGEWINFMNSGDIFASNEVIRLIGKQISEEIDLIYGHAVGIQENEERIFRKAGNPADIWKSGQLRHNALFARTALVQAHPFSTDAQMKVVADFDFMYKMFALNKQYKTVDKTVMEFEIDGVSSQRSRIQEIYDVFKVHARHKALRPIPYGFHIWKFFRFIKNRSKNLILRILARPVSGI